MCQRMSTNVRQAIRKLNVHSGSILLHRVTNADYTHSNSACAAEITKGVPYPALMSDNYIYVKYNQLQPTETVPQYDQP